jgi:alkylation response protein AidB-like acyl-CoA dehydrogenase
MASFIPNHRKKLERLKLLEADLRRLLDQGALQDKLLELAAEIRDCRIRVLRAKQNKNRERNAWERAAFLTVDRQIAAIRELSPEAVLAEYRQKDTRQMNSSANSI